jgi:hypothetical protein
MLLSRVGSGLPTDIRLGLNGLLWKNTLAYHSNSSILAIKSFITLVPGSWILESVLEVSG